MKHTLLTLAILAAAAVGANATILVQDDFSGTNGPLVGTTPDVGGIWTNHSGTPGQIQIVSNQVLLTDSASEDANSAFTATTLGSVFYSFDFSLADPSNTGTDFEYFSHFKDDGTSNFTGRVDAVDFTLTGFKVGISSTSTAQSTWATELTYATTYSLIVGYDFSTHLSTLWIDATSMGDTNIVSLADTLTSLEGFAFRQSSSSPNLDLTIDSLIVATTFAEVVPEPTACALFGAGALFWVLRRKRTA